jgi:hypothetical protein
MPTPNGRPNSDVLKPWANGFELSRGPQHQWIIDFGVDLSESEATLFEAPFAYATEHVRAERKKNNRERRIANSGGASRSQDPGCAEQFMGSSASLQP